MSIFKENDTIPHQNANSIFIRISVMYTCRCHSVLGNSDAFTYSSRKYISGQLKYVNWNFPCKISHEKFSNVKNFYKFFVTTNIITMKITNKSRTQFAMTGIVIISTCANIHLNSAFSSSKFSKLYKLNI